MRPRWLSCAVKDRVNRCLIAPGWQSTAVAACVPLGISSGRAGMTASVSFPPPVPERKHQAQAELHQQWRSAAGQEHMAGPPPNYTVPQSLRGRHPLRPEQPVPTRGRNVAEVIDAPVVAAHSLDPATSREVPAERRANWRADANTDGTRTKQFSPEPLNYRNAGGTGYRWMPRWRRSARLGLGANLCGNPWIGAARTIASGRGLATHEEVSGVTQGGDWIG